MQYYTRETLQLEIISVHFLKIMQHGKSFNEWFYRSLADKFAFFHCNLGNEKKGKENWTQSSALHCVLYPFCLNSSLHASKICCRHCSAGCLPAMHDWSFSLISLKSLLHAQRPCCLLLICLLKLWNIGCLADWSCGGLCNTSHFNDWS